MLTDTLSLLLMGDTQFYFACDEDNIQCKSLTDTLRPKFFLDKRLNFINHAEINDTLLEGREYCRRLESRFSNRVQRQAIDALLSSMDQKPAALIINGDLTQYGLVGQLHEFRQYWYDNFSIPFLLGLGNHDYQDNFDECEMNICAHTMLSWYTEYVRNKYIVADIQGKASRHGLEISGSLAYTKLVCSTLEKICAHVIQLNNAVNYSVSFTSFLVKWNISTPEIYLKNKLNELKSTSYPILLNMHQCEEKHIPKIREMITNWILSTKSYFANQKIVPKIGAFYAHWHPNHNATLECINGTKAPFVYVGSVPNNRFSKIDITATSATITGYKALDSKMNSGKVLKALKTFDLWGPCVETEKIIFEEEAVEIETR